MRKDSAHPGLALPGQWLSALSGVPAFPDSWAALPVLLQPPPGSTAELGEARLRVYTPPVQTTGVTEASESPSVTLCLLFSLF